MISSELLNCLRDISSTDENSAHCSHFTYFNPKRYWNVQSNQYETFWNTYLNLVDKQNKGTSSNNLLNVGEKPGKYIPVIADFKIKFQQMETPDYEDSERINDIIPHFVYCYQQTMLECLNINNDVDYYPELICCVLEQENEYIEHGEKIVQLRLQFPFCKIEPNILKRVIRTRVITLLRKRNVIGLFHCQPINDWDTIISATVGDEPISMYGSVVDSKYPSLALTNIFAQIELADLEATEYTNTYIEDIFEYKHHSHIECGLISPEIFDEYTPDELIPVFLSLEYDNKVVTLKPNVDINGLKSTYNNRTIGTPSLFVGEEGIYDETDLDMIKQLLPLLKSDRAKHESYWLDVGRALHNSDKGSQQAYSEWVAWTERHGYRTDDDCNDYWFSFDISNPITVKTVAWYARIDNLSEYDKWHKRKYTPYLEKASSCTHTDVAHAFYWIYWLDFLCSSAKDKSWYVFANHTLREADSGMEIRKVISGGFEKYFKIYRTELSKAGQDAKDETTKAKCELSLKKVMKLIDKLKYVPFKSSIMTESMEFFKDDKFITYANMNFNLMGIDGGILECCSTEAIIRDGKPEDYVTISSPIKYNSKFTWHSKPVMAFMKWMKQCFIYDDLIEYVLCLFASCFQSTNKEKIAPIFTGESASNSKSSLFNLISLIFGPYYGIFDASVLADKNTDSGKATPQLARVRYCKIVCSAELGEDINIRADVIKKHTGMDKMQARFLRENPTDFMVLYTLFIMCNKVPIIQGADSGIMDRIRVIICGSKWAKSGVPLTEEEQFKQRIFKMDPLFSKTLPYMAPGAFWVLIQYYSIYATKGLREPPCVTEATEKYHNDNDLYKMFISEMLEQAIYPGSITPDKPYGIQDLNQSLSVNDMHATFKGWLRVTFPSMHTVDKPAFCYHITNLMGKADRNQYPGIKVREASSVVTL